MYCTIIYLCLINKIKEIKKEQGKQFLYVAFKIHDYKVMKK